MILIKLIDKHLAMPLILKSNPATAQPSAPPHLDGPGLGCVGGAVHPAAGRGPRDGRVLELQRKAAVGCRDGVDLHAEHGDV